jgi:hypothetical protein
MSAARRGGIGASPLRVALTIDTASGELEIMVGLRGRSAHNICAQSAHTPQAIEGHERGRTLAAIRNTTIRGTP